MTTTNSVQAAQRAAGTRIDGAINGGTLRRFHYDIPLTGQAAGDVVNLGKKPRNFRFMYGLANSDTDLGASATIAVGVVGTPGKYRAAATHRTTDTPAIFGTRAAAAGTEIEEEDLILTVGAAALPGSGNLSIEIVASEF